MTSSPFPGLPSPTGEPLADLMRRAEAMITGDAEGAQALLLEGLAQARAAGDHAQEALALCLMGNTCFFTSRYPEAREWFHIALELAERAPVPAVQVRALSGLGITANVQGDYGGAMECFLDCLRLAQEHGDEAGRGRVLSNIGVLRAELGEHDLALEAHLDVIAVGERLENPVIHSSGTVNVVVDYYALGEYEKALDLAAATLPLVRERGFRQHEVVMQTHVLLSLVELGRCAEAAALGHEVLPLALNVQDHEYITMLHIGLGRALLGLDRADEAETLLNLALDNARHRDLKVLERNALKELSAAQAARHEWKAAYELSQAYHRLERTLHAQEVDRKAKVIGAQMQIEILRREAEAERLRNTELAQANSTLQAMQETLAYRATHDALTGLANRAHFQAELERALHSGHPFGVLFLDLDRFKQVNDTLGHNVGDELLQEVARRLSGVVRSGDLVARMGGDEFTIILRALRGTPDAERVAHKILNALSQSFEVCGHALHVTASIGVAVAPEDGADATSLQKHADIAMYRAKHEGKNGVRTFQPAMGDETTERVDLERDLREALVREEFVLHYQGQFDVRSQALVGFEALVRWQHPTQGLLPPGKFIHVAEDSELILPLGDWVLRQACRQAAAWGANERGFTISVNVSALQFEHANLLQSVEQALASSGLNPRRLILELTESVVLRHPEAAAGHLTRLRDLGVRIALDDFGTGHSSLSLLRQMPIDVLKIDRSFIQDSHPWEAASSRVLIGVMVTLAHGLKMKVTAEGVETAEQHALLRELGCDVLQGFLLSRPLAASQAEALLSPPAA
ncbi:EAL domain-containing protein [Deinococcus navajonensis]|uniref:EAL domain-containing protein n=1 Tax=Deinococcus navajonensis TaxID=309884 RepID=A0ABV8XKN5_9DEIO